MNNRPPIELTEAELLVLLHCGVAANEQLTGNALTRLRGVTGGRTGETINRLVELELVHAWRVGPGYKGENLLPKISLLDRGRELIRTLVFCARENANSQTQKKAPKVELFVEPVAQALVIQ